MSVLTVTIYEFRQFLQILMWIAIPLVIVSVLITVIVHYWRKRKHAEEADAYPLLDEDSPVLAQAATLPVEETEAYKGIIWLRNKYQHDIELAARKNEALKESLEKVEQKYADLVAQTGEQNTSAPVVHDETPGELHQKLLASEEKIKSLEHQVSEIKLSEAAGVSDSDSSSLIHPVELHQQLTALQSTLILKEQEKELLEKKIVENAASQDMTVEKNKQINFLQQQLDERIRAFHEVEFRQVSAAAKVAELQEQVGILGHEKQHWQEVHQSQAMTIKHSRKELESLAVESRHRQDELHQKLDAEIKRSKDLEGKLHLSSSLLQKIVKEINDNAFTPQQPYHHNGHSVFKHPEEAEIAQMV